MSLCEKSCLGKQLKRSDGLVTCLDIFAFPKSKILIASTKRLIKGVTWTKYLERGIIFMCLLFKLFHKMTYIVALFSE